MPETEGYEDPDQLSELQRALLTGDAVQRGDGSTPLWRPGAAPVPSALSLAALNIRKALIAATAQGVAAPERLFILGAIIEGELDLGFRTLSCPVAFVNCVFVDALNFEQLTLPGLSLNGSVLCGRGSQMAPFVGDRLEVKGNFSAAEGTEVWGDFRLPGARVGGQLQLQKSRFGRSGEPSRLFAQNIAVGDSVFLSKTLIHGTVDFTSARIGDQLTIRDGWIFVPQEWQVAVEVSRAQMASFQLDGEFYATGQIDLDHLSADSVSMNGALVLCKQQAGSYALTAKFSHITGDLSITNCTLDEPIASITHTFSATFLSLVDS